MAVSMMDRLAAARATFSKWLHYRRDIDELHRMDDRKLADIGLSRSEIGHAVWFGRFGDYRSRQPGRAQLPNRWR